MAFHYKTDWSVGYEVEDTWTPCQFILFNMSSAFKELHILMVKLFFLEGEMILFISPTMMLACLIVKIYLNARHFLHYLYLNLDQT